MILHPARILRMNFFWPRNSHRLPGVRRVSCPDLRLCRPHRRAGGACCAAELLEGRTAGAAAGFFLILFSPPWRLTRETMGLTPMVFCLGFPDFQFMDSHNGLPRSFGLILTGFCGCQSEVQVCKYLENDFFAGPEQSTFKWHSAFWAGSGPLYGVSPQKFLEKEYRCLVRSCVRSVSNI